MSGARRFEIGTGPDRLSGSRRGQGPPLLLALPLSRGPGGIETLLEGLAQHVEVITWEQRGVPAGSPAPDMASHAADARAVLDALDLSGVHVLAHSTGCGIALALAAQHPGVVRSLVLAAPWTHGDAFLTGMQGLRVAAARGLGPVDHARFSHALLYPPEYRRAHAGAFEALARAAAAAPQDAVHIEARLGAILAFDARPLLPALAVDPSVLVARDDALMPPWFAEEIVARAPGARLEVLDGGGHMITETRPDALVSAVAVALRGVG